MVDFLINLLVSIPCVLFALAFHELAHGYVAYKLGDPTAKLMGRLTLNPIKHLDPVGTVCMIFFRFGWAKPVPVDTRFFKKPRRDICLTALAGPMANLLLALFGSFVFCLSNSLIEKLPIVYGGPAYYVVLAYITLVTTFIWLNISLAIFNLIPLPPLDGSRIFLIWLPYHKYAKVLRYERQISMAFMFLLIFDSRIFGGRFASVLSLIVNFIYNGMISLFTLIF